MIMQIVAGLSIKNLEPRSWSPASQYYLPSLNAIMVSYGEFHQMPKQLDKAKEMGLREYLDVPKGTDIFLDNGAFYFLRSGDKAERRKYQDFVEKTQPDWYP